MRPRLGAFHHGSYSCPWWLLKGQIPRYFCDCLGLPYSAEWDDRLLVTALYLSQ